MNKARRQTPTSLPGRGWPESDRIATHALRTISVLSAIVRKISDALIRNVKLWNSLGMSLKWKRTLTEFKRYLKEQFILTFLEII